MADSTLWWLAAGALVAVELITGTFYLLMISLGLVAAALLAHSGASAPWQWVGAAAMGGGAVLAWRAYQQARPQSNHNINMDVGQRVQVEHWQSDGTCGVHYRGAHWDATLQPGQVAQAGSYVIAEVVGNRLILKSASST